MYREEDYLQLSGIQHFDFCRRQWALIHIEQQWQDNLRTVEGNIMHERAHNGPRTEGRGEYFSIRGMRVASAELGISGICDVVEFHMDDNGVPIQGKEGRFRVIPVEYKKGTNKESDCDRLQLAAQAMCLEEMLCCEINVGYLYYGEPHRRTQVDMTDELREKVRTCCEEMHQLYDRRHTPKVKASKACNACSMKEICMPKLCKEISVKIYIKKHLDEEA